MPGPEAGGAQAVLDVWTSSIARTEGCEQGATSPRGVIRPSSRSDMSSQKMRQKSHGTTHGDERLKGAFDVSGLGSRGGPGPSNAVTQTRETPYLGMCPGTMSGLRNTPAASLAVGWPTPDAWEATTWDARMTSEVLSPSSGVLWSPVLKSTAKTGPEVSRRSRPSRCHGRAKKARRS
jgi:hypothetical protein